MQVSSYTNFTEAEKDELKALVRKALKEAVMNHALLPATEPDSMALLNAKPCFITFHVKDKLRGCIGTYSEDNPLWDNVRQYTFYSACRDPRFEPISKRELPDVHFTISILSPLQQLPNTGEADLLQLLRIGEDGLLLKQSQRTAIFLPAVWQKLPTADEFVTALKEKGGWDSDYWSPDIEIFIFTTEVFEGKY